MYSIIILSLYFSFYSSLSPSLTVFLPSSLYLFSSLSPSISFFRAKTVRILLSCCLDLTPDLFSQNRIRLFFSRYRRYRRVITRH